MKNEAPVINNSFESVLKHHRRGALMSELSEHLQKLTTAVRENGKGGSLILKLRVEPANGDGSAMSVLDEITLKAPVPSKPNSIFYTTDDGRLVREDPNQQEMNLKVVEPAQNLVPASEAVNG